MTDPTKRLAEVERNSVPDLWEDIRSRRPRDLRAEHELSGRGRLLVIFVAFAVAIAGIGGAVYAFRGTHPAPRPAGQTAVGGSGLIALWPEQTLTMAQDASTKAAAGDPNYTWQLDQKQVALRFATDVLGWANTTSNPLSVTFGADTPVGAIATVSGPPAPCPTPGCAPGTRMEVNVYLDHSEPQQPSGVLLVTGVDDPVFRLRPNGGPPVHQGDIIRIPTKLPDGTNLWAGITYGWCGGEEWSQPVTVQGGQVTFTAGSGAVHLVKPSPKNCAGQTPSPSTSPSGPNAFVWVTKLSYENQIPFQLWQFLATKFARASAMFEGIPGPTLTNFSASPIEYIPTPVSSPGPGFAAVRLALRARRIVVQPIVQGSYSPAVTEQRALRLAHEAGGSQAVLVWFTDNGGLISGGERAYVRHPCWLVMTPNSQVVYVGGLPPPSPPLSARGTAVDFVDAKNGRDILMTWVLVSRASSLPSSAPSP